MSVDIDYLKKRGVSSDAYRGIFSETPDKWPEKVRRLINNISARIRDGLNTGVDEKVARAYCAIDAAYNIPYDQTTPTLVNDILSRFHGPDDEEAVRGALDDWGLGDDKLWMRVKGVDGHEHCLPNPPVFFNVVPNLVKAYTTSVLGRLFNARNKNPFLQFKPSRESEEEEILCNALTDRIDKISMNYGYADVLRCAIDQMLKYGLNLTFPREEWHCENQTVTCEPYTDPATGIVRTEKDVVVKEGKRYFNPHPTRFYYDLKYPLTSFNTDTGCEFAGHWHVLSYGQILDNEDYWNRDHIFAGTNWFTAPLKKFYWTEVFPCKLKFPEGYKWGAPIQREDKAQLYVSADRDKAIFVAEHYDKIVPANWGLGDYNYPVWHRFTMAGDDTPVFVEPCASCPITFMGYDYSENNDRMPSLALEVIPWQDWLGNILSQILLTAKQNLERVIFYDTNLVNADDIRRMENMGEQRYRGMHFIGIDTIAHRIPGLQQSGAFFPVNLGQVSVAEMFSTLQVFLNIMQRVLLIAAQGTGAAGPHQQGKSEIAMLQAATQDRELLLGSAVDSYMDAWQVQIFSAAKNYADPEFEAEVDAHTPGLEEAVKKIGFELVRKGKTKAVVKGNWKKIGLRDFARTAEGDKVDADKESGQAMMNVIGIIGSHPDLYADVGKENIKLMIEFAAHLLGAPADFRIRPADESDKKPDEVPKEVIEAIKAAQTATLKDVEAKIGKPAAQEVGQMQQEFTQLQQQVQQLEKLSKVAQALVDKRNVEAQKAQEKAQADAQAAQAEQARKNTELQSEEQRRNAEAAARIAREQAESDARLALERQQAEARIENDRLVAQAKANQAPKKKD